MDDAHVHPALQPAANCLPCDLVESLMVRAMLEGAPSTAAGLGSAILRQLPAGPIQADLVEQVGLRLPRLVGPLRALGMAEGGDS